MYLQMSAHAHPQPPSDRQASQIRAQLAVVGDDPIADLTPREREVLALIADGLSNRAVCQALVISPKTLERHVQNIFLKLGLRPCGDDHRRVRAVLCYLSSPLAVSG